MGLFASRDRAVGPGKTARLVRKCGAIDARRLVAGTPDSGMPKAACGFDALCAEVAMETGHFGGPKNDSQELAPRKNKHELGEKSVSQFTSSVVFADGNGRGWPDLPCDGVGSLRMSARRGAGLAGWWRAGAVEQMAHREAGGHAASNPRARHRPMSGTACDRGIGQVGSAASAASARGVPVFGKCQTWPSQLVVIGCGRSRCPCVGDAQRARPDSLFPQDANSSAAELNTVIDLRRSGDVIVRHDLRLEYVGSKRLSSPKISLEMSLAREVARKSGDAK